MRAQMTMVPILLPHLLHSICNVKCTDFFVILELEELVAAVPSHVHEHVRSLVGQQSF
jgi:hypothetical protein